MTIWLFACLIACQGSPEETVENTQNTETVPAKELATSYHEVQIPFAEATVKLPDSHKAITIDDMRKYIENSDLEPADKSARIQAVTNMRRLGSISLYADTANFFNFVVFIDTEYIYISRRMAKDYMGMLEQNLERSWREAGEKFEKADSKYLHSKKKEIVKVKYKIFTEGEPAYFTQYIVSGKDNSVIMLNTNTADQIDLEPQVKKLSIL